VANANASGVHFTCKRIASELNRLNTKDFRPEVRTDFVLIRSEIDRWGTDIRGAPYEQNWPGLKPRFLRLIQGYVGENTSAEASIGRRFKSLFIDPLRDAFPQTIRLLTAAEALLAQTEDIPNWNNVANTCREALIAFSKELRSALPQSVPAEIKEGDIKNTVTHILRSRELDDRFRQTLAALVDSLWNHIQNIVHRASATRDDAERCFLLCILAITEIVRATRT